MSDNVRKPRVAGLRPLPTPVIQGLTYFWCSCGRSRHQPFCDNSHVGTGFEPMPFIARKDEIVFFCNCKHSTESPICDGKTHQTLRASTNADD